MIESQSLTSKLDALPFSRWHIFMIVGLGTIWIFDGYEVSLISLFSHYIIHETSEHDFKLIVTAYQIGCIIGSIGFGFCAYFYGRKTVFIITLCIYAVGILFSILNLGIQMFFFGRLLTGISVGGQYTSIFSAIDEFLPPKIRGRVDIGIDGTWHFGGAFAAALNIALGEISQWRVLFGIGYVGIFALICIRKNIPESPRWLLLKGKRREAEKIVYEIEECVFDNGVCLKDIDLEDEEGADRQYLNESSADDIAELNMRTVWKQIKNIFENYKKRLAVSMVLIFSQAFYFNSVYYKFPILLVDKFNLDKTQIPLYMLPLSITAFISTLLVGPFFDILGRRKMLLITYVGSAILLGVTFLAQTSVSYLVLTIIMFMFSSPASSSANLISSEIFPTSTRSIVLSFIFILSMLGAMGGVWQNSHIVSIILMSFSGILGFLLCPNAENKSLEEINQH